MSFFRNKEETGKEKLELQLEMGVSIWKLELKLIIAQMLVKNGRCFALWSLTVNADKCDNIWLHKLVKNAFYSCKVSIFLPYIPTAAALVEHLG